MVIGGKCESGADMKVLITGNQGYIGPMVARHLRKALPGAYLIGYDTSYFALSTTNAQVWPERLYDEQLNGDVREIPELCSRAWTLSYNWLRFRTIRWALPMRRLRIW